MNCNKRAVLDECSQGHHYTCDLRMIALCRSVYPKQHVEMTIECKISLWNFSQWRCRKGSKLAERQGQRSCVHPHQPNNRKRDQKMSVKYESDRKQFSRNLSEALAEVSAMIDHVASEFGSNSSQVGECYLELRGFRLLPDHEAHSAHNLGETSSNVGSEQGAGSVENTLLGKYLLHDPVHQESHLRDVESALISSLDGWTDTKPEKVKQSLFVLLDLAACWEIIGNSSLAGALTQRVAGLCQQHLEPTDDLTVSAFIDTAAYCVKRGKVDEADSLLKAALDKCETNPEAMGRYGPRVLMNLAAVAVSRGQAPIAAGHLDRALEVAEQAPEPDRYHILEVLCNQAKTCVAMNQRERFDQVASRILNEAKEYRKCDSDFAAECMMTLFGLYQAQGRFDEARSISRSLTEMMAQ